MLSLNTLPLPVIIILLVLLPSISCLTSAPYWGMSSSIQTYQIILANTASGSYSTNAFYTSYFARAYNASDVPRLVIGVNYYYWWSAYYSYSVTATPYQTYLGISFSFASTIYSFYINAMLYTAEVYPIIQHTSHSIAYTAIGSVYNDNAVYSYMVMYPSAVNISHNILIIPYTTAIYQYTYCFGVTSKASIHNTTYFEAGYSFRQSCSMSGSISTQYLIIDRTNLQETKTLYVDHYSLNIAEGLTLSTKWTTSYNKAQSASYIETFCNHTMIGVNEVWGTATPSSLLFVYQCNSTVSYTSSYISVLNFTVTGFRKRLCDPGTKYYNDLDNLCYDKCPDRFYSKPFYHYCAPCPYYCFTCSEDGLYCLSCNTTTDFRTFINTTLINYTKAGTCQCMLGYYDSKLNSSICLPCHYTCLTCANVSTTCTQCQSYRKLLGDYTCPCIPGFEDVASTPNCTEKCGDGVKFVVECDDGNTVGGDGCSAGCVVETNYTCAEKTKSSPSVCGYNKEIVFSVGTVVVNNVSFTVSVTVTMTPTLPWMNTFNFSTLTVNDTDVNITSFLYSAGTLTLNLKYSDNSDGNTILFTFQSPNTPTTQYLPNSSFSFSIPALITPAIPPSTPGYLATSVQLLITMSIINIIVYILGGLKLAYVQTLWTLQISYFCLLGSFVIQPFQETFKVINIAANGYNRVVWNEINFNSASLELARFGYNDQFVGNFNVMLIIQVIIILVSVIFYGLSKIKKWSKARKGMLAIHSFLLYDATLSFTMFNIMNSSFAMGLQIIIFLEQGLSSLFYINILGIALSFGITLTTLCLFIFRANQFTNNVGMFKHDKASRYHPIIMLTVRFSMGFTMGILYRHWFSGLTVLGIQLAYGIYISVKNPYTLPFLLRAILNEGTILQNLLVGFLYQVYRINEEDKGGLVPLWIQLFLLGVSCLTSLFYMMYTVYVKIRNMRSNKVSIEDDSGAQGQGWSAKKESKKKVRLDYDFNATIQNFDLDNNMEISEIGKGGSGGKKNNRMKGEDY